MLLLLAATQSAGLIELIHGRHYFLDGVARTMTIACGGQKAQFKIEFSVVTF